MKDILDAVDDGVPVRKMMDSRQFSGLFRNSGKCDRFGVIMRNRAVGR